MADKIRKIQRTAKGLDIFCLILKILFFMFGIFIIYSGIATYLHFYQGIDLPLVKNTSFHDNPTARTWIKMSQGVVNMIFGFFIFHLAHCIFRRISKAETPFLAKNVKDLKIIAILILISSFVPSYLFGMLSIALSTSGQISVNGSNVLLAVILFGLALIFDYGYQLQVEVDETL